MNALNVQIRGFFYCITSQKIERIPYIIVGSVEFNEALDHPLSWRPDVWMIPELCRQLLSQVPLLLGTYIFPLPVSSPVTADVREIKM